MFNKVLALHNGSKSPQRNVYLLQCTRRMPDEQIKLSYSSIRLPWHKQQRLQKAAQFLVALFIAGGLFGWAWEGIIGKWVMLTYWLNRCENYSPPAATAVFTTTDPAVIIALKKSANSPATSGVFLQDPTGAYVVPQEWWKLQPYVPKYHFDGVAFMRERTRPDGLKRLVVFHLQARGPTLHQWLPFTSVSTTPPGGRMVVLIELAADVLERAGARPQLSSVETTPATIIVPYHAPLTLFAGQPDPQDQSHFTIAYTAGSTRGTIDGWLANDDSVKVQPHDGPLVLFSGAN